MLNSRIMNLRHNAKLYSLLFLLAFLAAQVSLVSHTIKHGVLDHTHAGKQCEQCVFAKNYNADTPTSTPVNIDFTGYKVSYNAASDAFVVTDTQASNQPRAPPFYS
jgi:hypothetical protein